MATQKATIALPEDLLIAVDKAAHERGSSRSAFISMVLRRALRAKRDAAVTRQLDELFADEELAQRQSQEAEALDSLGTDWSDEDWT